MREVLSRGGAALRSVFSSSRNHPNRNDGYQRHQPRRGNHGH